MLGTGRDGMERKGEGVAQAVIATLRCIPVYAH